MEDQYQYRRNNVLHRNNDDWEEVHQQMIEVQQKNAVQKKSLTVSNPGDADEKEADDVARKVAGGESATVHGTGGTINRKGQGDAETTPEFQSKLESSKGKGQSLPEHLQDELGGKMGANFSGVKIHTGGEAHGMNENVNAKAFTHGQDVYFREGEYNAQSSSGKELLAHELVHTVQQSGENSADNIQRSANLQIEKTIDLDSPPMLIQVLDIAGIVIGEYKPDTKGFNFVVGDEYAAGSYTIKITTASGGVNYERITKQQETSVKVIVKTHATPLTVPQDVYSFENKKIGGLADIFKLYPNITSFEIDLDYSLPDIVIMQTQEFKSLMNPSSEWQKKYNLSYEEAVFVCRKILNEMAKGSFDWEAKIDDFIRETLSTTTSSFEESDRSSWTLLSPYLELYNCLDADIPEGMSDIDMIEYFVKQYALDLWNVDRTQRDDTSLYVARMKARTILKRN